MDSEFIPIGENESFCFSCTMDVPCFNQCCRDLNQILMPYDILRLKQHLGMDSGRFLEAFTIRRVGPATGLPTVSLKFDAADRLKCPFVTPSGCRVYIDRPSSCRTYPLIRALQRNRETGKTLTYYALVKEAHCRGFDHTATAISIKQWVDDQKMAEYNHMNDLMMEVISLKNDRLPGPLDTTIRQQIYEALYSLDEFRGTLSDIPRISTELQLDEDTMEKAESDDPTLLRIGIRWVKHLIIAP
ncbi:MAG: YkgJ family cysteine cluster protein [Desulfobacteraceae bacterium]|nr:YkgJ family cysteine cluster protein [Desulfobacteraceae bacterium]